MSDCVAALPYFDALPVEILWLIFEEVFESPDDWRVFLGRRIRCRGVCVRWRMVITNHPSFWNAITVARPTTQEFFQVCVERSSAVPLSLTIDASEHGSLTDDGGSVPHLVFAQPLHFYNQMLQEVLTTCLERVVSLRIESDGYYNLHSVASVLADLPMPCVSTLSVRVNRVFSASPLCLFPAPSWGPVTNLSCQGILPVIGSPGSYNALDVLVVASVRGLEILAFSGFLHSLQWLTELHITNVDCDESTRPTVVELASVKILHLRYDDHSSARFLQGLHFPNLLTFTVVVSDAETWNDIYASCNHFLSRPRHFGLSCVTDDLAPQPGLWDMLDKVITANVATAGRAVTQSLWEWLREDLSRWSSLYLLELDSGVREEEVEEYMRRCRAYRVGALSGVSCDICSSVPSDCEDVPPGARSSAQQRLLWLA
ncbi:hypothetical protein R3P38DRAFT_3240431 [Favolaschia claudopus]|uniref:F-box domain-containing protein n=1 Tax=Favolaschia claudopus TaxID=2862362 RepID=A0AAV9Z6Z4_9AGAR